ncbi:ABC transporter ATP-binding protein [Pararobbsia silviterrae]|uniref:ABC transporter ATP-binding protein n=1 Tax=Pararobbsia silviterrae TaxID=1792498 RepID=A0A494XGF1_9BURK|nr:ABC transporter ATP-binding protein [Pararobbsia silviterrae]RKP49730.1 ABC transporter ATP-binding protein [Pararobbsia silviterrae]
MAAISIAGLTHSFDGVPVLRGVDLDVASGRLVALLGPSGSGKTTLLRLICGFDRAEQGSIRVGSTIVSAPGVHLPPDRRQIGYVPQEGGLFPHLSVADNIVFGLPRAQRKARHRVSELLDMVGLPASFATRAPQQLSGGQQQRVALARALAPSPALVLLDEPFSALDTALRQETRQAVADALAASGATALLVTHDQSEALSMGSQVAVMWHGRLIQVDTPETLYRTPVTSALARFVGEAVLLDGVVEGGTVECALGRVRVQADLRHDRSSDVEVMIRPEQIRIEPSSAAAQASRAPRADASTAQTVAARVADIAYFGHDASIRLQIDRDPSRWISARVSGQVPLAAGQHVELSLQGGAVIYSRN